jgi:hypothetical protein
MLMTTYQAAEIQVFATVSGFETGSVVLVDRH